MKPKDLFMQILYIIWGLPQVLVGLCMLPFLGKLRFIRYENYCWIFEGEKMAGGISLGCFIFLSKYNSGKEATIRHELGHVKQSHILGPLYLIVIGLPSILNAMFGFTQCYHDFYPEAWANKLMNVKVRYATWGCTTYIDEE